MLTACLLLDIWTSQRSHARNPVTPCRAIANEGEYDKVVRAVERVDEVVKEDVLILKASPLTSWDAKVLARDSCGLLGLRVGCLVRLRPSCIGPV